MNCPFCEYVKNSNSRLVLNDQGRFLLIGDKYPITRGHSLLISKFHATFMSQLSEEDLKQLGVQIEYSKMFLSKLYPDVVGFNVGFNSGRAAGQTVDHFHVHIIPRREGDSVNPFGGIRKVVDGNGRY